jgi:hypothetical protein
VAQWLSEIKVNEKNKETRVRSPARKKNIKKASAKMKASDESLLLYSFILKHFEKKEFCIG